MNHQSETSNKYDIALAKFSRAPIREFNDGKKAKGLFQSELSHFKIEKSIIKKLVRKNILKEGTVQIKGALYTFYWIENNIL